MNNGKVKIGLKLTYLTSKITLFLTAVGTNKSSCSFVNYSLFLKLYMLVYKPQAMSGDQKEGSGRQWLIVCKLATAGNSNRKNAVGNNSYIFSSYLFYQQIDYPF